ncbi:MAG: DeoR/GlpR transcriptional regulator [Alphaproteobacteria bacterium]|nr:MAG: DeoR/GlpR transcriptional regulator [Alphaproteobacteria bacterium]
MAARTFRTRRAQILELLRRKGRAGVEELAERFDTTPQTIRKDLAVLAEQGHVLRYHGGASLLAGTEYVRYEVRQQIAREEKERIGRAVAALIPNNCAVMINAGTTTAAAARHLARHAGVKIVTDNVTLAHEIKGFRGCEILVPGGVVRASDGAILGELAIDFIRQFRADIALIGAAAIGADGALLDYDLREAAVARAMIENARNVIIAADSGKFGRIAPVCIGQLAQARTLVTDTAAPRELRELCGALDVGLTLA